MLLGAAGAGLVWVIRLGLPESPRWLAEQGRAVEADRIVAAMEARVERSGRVLPVVTDPGDASPGAGRLADIFARPYRRRTAILVVFNIAQAVGFYGFGNWAPSLIAARGHGVTQSLLYAFIIAIAYPLGPLLCTLFADRIERRLQIAAAIATALLGLGFAGQSSPVVLITLGIGITLANNLLSFSYHAYQAELYPTRIRARAVGFVYAWSRLSTVVSSFIIAALLGAFGTVGVFAFIALAMAVVVVAVGLFGPATRGQALERVSG